jgi:hypothetical protein
MPDIATKPEVVEGDGLAAQTDPKGQPKDPGDLEGLIKKKDDLLAEVKELKRKLKQIEDQEAENKKAKLEKKGEYEELLKQVRTEKENAEKELQTERRKNALRDAAAAAKFNPKFLKLLDDAEFDEDNKLIEAEAYFEGKRQELPEAFLTDQKEPAKRLTAPTNPKPFKSTPQEVAETSHNIQTMSVSDFEKHEGELTEQALKQLGLRR